MSPGYPWLVMAPVIGLAVYTVSHLVLVHARSWRGPYPPLILAFFPGLIAMAACSGWALATMRATATDAVGFAALDGLTYAALGWGYFHFVNMGVASLRIRMLRELEDAGGILTRGQLLAGYNSRSVADLRLQRLTAGGHVAVIEGRYRLGPKRRFLLVARLFDALRRFLFGPQYRPVSAPSADDHPRPRGPRTR